MATAQLELDLDAIYVAVDNKRRQLGMHRSQVAQELGVAPAALTRLDHGMAPSATTMIRLMAWLGQDGSSFTKGTEESK